MSKQLITARSGKQRDGEKPRRSHDPLGDRLLASALAFRDEIVNEAGVVLTRGMRGELPGSDAREQRLCAQAIRSERVPSASSMPTVAPRVIVQIAPFAQVSARQTWVASQQLQAGDTAEWSRVVPDAT